MAVVGPMARSVEDLVLTLDIIAGPDEAVEGRAYRLGLPQARGEKLSDFRVLVVAWLQNPSEALPCGKVRQLNNLRNAAL